MAVREPAPASPTITLLVPAELQPLMRARKRAPRVTVASDGTSTIGHVVGACGIPLTEVGALLVAGCAVADTWVPSPGSVVELTARPRPQQAPTHPPRFVLDVHLGTLARRMRLLGIDAAWSNDADDADLVEQAVREQRVVLTRDRGLLLRRLARDGAYVRGQRPDEQLADVLERFAPPLAPWTRCPSCNTLLEAAPKSEVLDRLEPGTRRSYDRFARCPGCGKVYWSGAHYPKLRQIVERHSSTSG